MNWQPIENAPKDGTVVDLWDGSRFSDCHWSEDNERWQDVNHRMVYAAPTHFCIVTLPGEQQPESVNQRLLDAAEQARVWIEADESHRGSKTWTGNELRAAIEAAKQATKV